jgi:MFS superfamily sulfate permease-like transporter
MLAATSLFHYLPQATLTAIVFSTIVRLLDFEKANVRAGVWHAFADASRRSYTTWT